VRTRPVEGAEQVRNSQRLILLRNFGTRDEATPADVRVFMSVSGTGATRYLFVAFVGPSVGNRRGASMALCARTEKGRGKLAVAVGSKWGMRIGKAKSVLDFPRFRPTRVQYVYALIGTQGT
jgi:hypothetical protein